MLLIHTALHAEARAIITHFKLKRQHDEHAFACFSEEDIFLVESGTGKTNAATAVGWLSAKVSAENPVWLNIGMAGHANHDVGTLILANHIEDQAKGHQWNPPLLKKANLMSSHLLTVDSPDFSYPENTMVDMEASGFFTAACRFTNPELVHSMKVISDNRQNPPIRMKPKAVEALFKPHLLAIKQLSEELLKLRHHTLLPHSEK